MPVKLHDAIETGSYITDGKRLLLILSLSRTEVLVEDALSGQETVLGLHELARPRWRRVWQEKAAA